MKTYTADELNRNNQLRKEVNMSAPTHKLGWKKGYYKIPRRAIYCDTIKAWLASVVQCYVVYKLSPPPDVVGGPPA